MAGLEIAGVVLGSIPLVISALEHYSDGVSTIRSMQKYETVFEYLHTSFVTGLAIYRNSLEELLSTLALSDSELNLLMEESDMHAWEDPNLASKLRDRLGSSYLPFKSAVKQLHKKINLLGHKLQLDANFKPSWVSIEGKVNVQARDSFFRNPLNRIRGGFSSEKHKQLLTSLQDDIERIATLTSGAIALEPLRLSRKRASKSAHWNRYQKYAQRLYECLDSKWSAPCNCQCRHEANLRLSLHEFAESTVTNFSLVLTTKTDCVSTKRPWESRAVEVEPTEDSHLPSTQPANLPPTIMIHSPSAATSSWKHCLQAAPKIDDLCSALSTSAYKGLCMGVLNGTCVKHHMHLAPRLPLPKSIQNRTTLQDILASQNGASFPIKEKCTLVLALANAVMQLHDTPWLGETWTSDDICMLSYKKGTSVTEEPFLWKNFKSISKGSPPNRRNPFVRNATIFALGVALLEISYGRRLETFQTPEDLDDNGNRTPLTDCSIAYRMVETVHQRELPNFANAARRCVHCSFDVVVHSLKDDDLRERFYQGVVVPLRQDYEYATNGP